MVEPIASSDIAFQSKGFLRPRWIRGTRTFLMAVLIPVFILASCVPKGTPAPLLATPSPSIVPPTSLPTETAIPTPASTPTPKSRAVTKDGYTELHGSVGPIYSLSWAPNANLIASAGFGQVNVWDADAKERVATLEGHTSFVWGVSFSPDGKWIGSASVDGKVKVWQVSDFSEHANLGNAGAFCLAWSPDSKQIAVGSTSGRVNIWDIESQEKLQTFDAGYHTVSVAWSPDGVFLAAGRLDGSIVVWDFESGEQIIKISGYSKKRNDANGLAFSPDGKLLASANQDGYTYLWDVGTWEMHANTRQADSWLRGLAWSPDGELLVSTGEGAHIYLWNMETGESSIFVSIYQLPKWSLAWSPHGDQIAVGSGTYDNKRKGGILYLIDVP